LEKVVKPVRIAINGFGRIGRLVSRLIAKRTDLEVVAINDLVPSSNLAYLLKYDSTHGRFSQEIGVEDDALIINGKSVSIFSEKDPEALPWKSLNIDYVVESTGLFTTEESAAKHLKAGAKRVVISAPAKGALKTLVMGVNEQTYEQDKDKIVSNASCTTNCLAPITKVLLDNFGIEEGLMTTVHALTASQPTVDGPSKKDFRGGRGALQNVIPSSTGAAQAVSLCLPAVKGKLTGMALRVPVADVSVVDLTVRLTREVTYDDVCLAMRKASEGSLKGILGYTEDPVVSSDFIGSTYSAIFDRGAGIALNGHFFKVIAWYDNEMGYAARLVDLLAYMMSKEA
jgi:glyceraldehyde 3-phosphate dehydrogenase